MIELSRQAIVLSSCFRLVRFRAQIVAQAIGPPFSPCAHSPQRIERPKRLVRPEQILAERSASELLLRQSSRRVRPRLVRSSVETYAGFVTSRRPSSRRSASTSRLTRLRKPLFFGTNSYFQPAANNQIPTPRALASIAILCSGGFRIVQYHHLANSDCKRGRIPKRRRGSPRKNS